MVFDRLGDDVFPRLALVPGVVQPTRAWRRDMKRILVTVDHRKAAALGQSPLSVARHLATGAEGIDAGLWFAEDGSAEPIEVRFAPTGMPDVDAHLSWPMLVPGAGEAVPIRAIAQSRVVVEQGMFTSQDLNPVLDVRAGVDGRPLNFVVTDAEAAIAELVVPAGYVVSIEGENKDLTESRVSILRALAMSVLVVYLLLVAQFRSWIHPVTVMMAVPLSLAGVSLALWLTGKPVSMPVMIGLVLLVGTVVNNSILLVDVIRQRRDSGEERRDAIRQGVQSRFRPIMMTSLSTVIGMLPLALELALGAERFSPLAIAVIGGLLASTLLTMVVIPVLYDVADGFVAPRLGGGTVAVGASILVALLAMPLRSEAQTLSIDEAWDVVLEHPAALSSDLMVEAARARHHAATGRFFPQIELQARTTLRDPFEAAVLEIPIQLPDGSSPDPIRLGDDFDQLHSLSATLTQPLFTGGALISRRKATTAAKRVAEAQRKGTHGDLWMALVRAWYGQVVTSDSVAIRAEVLAASVAREASLGRLRAQGRAVDLELSAVSLKRAEQEQLLAEARASAATAKSALATLLGMQVTVPNTDVVEIARVLIGRQLPSGQAAMVEQSEAQAAVAKARGSAALGAVLPSIAFRASAQYSNPDLTEFPIVKTWGSYWDASLVMTWTLDGGVRLNEARGARLDARAAEAGSEALRRQVEVERAGTLASLELAPTRLGVASARVELASAALETAETSLAAGRGTTLIVMDRASDLALARAARLAAAFDIIVEFETARILGGASGPGTVVPAGVLGEHSRPSDVRP